MLYFEVILNVVTATNILPSTDIGHQKQSSLDNKRTYMWTWEAMYLLRNNEVLSWNHCCNGKAKITVYCELVFV